MAKTYVGLVCGATTGRVYAVVNPDDDSELDNPRFLLLGVGMASNQTTLAPPFTPSEEEPGEPPPLREPITLIKIPLALYMTFTNPDQIADWAKERIAP